MSHQPALIEHVGDRAGFIAMHSPMEEREEFTMTAVF